MTWGDVTSIPLQRDSYPPFFSDAGWLVNLVPLPARSDPYC